MPEMARVVLLLLALSRALFAQDNALSDDFLVRVWQSEEGLPGNVVRSIGQTSDGFLWVATAEGIAQFNGLEFKNLASNGNYRGPRLGFFRIFTPEDGSVWVSTFRGGLQKVVDGKLKGVIDDEAAPNSPLITRLVTYQNNSYFIRENNSVWTINEDQAEPVSSPSPGLLAVIEADRKVQMLCGRSDDNQSPTHLTDRSGGHWRLDTGALSYAPADETATSPPTPDFNGRLQVSDMLEDREGNLWLASPVQGLIRIRHQRVTLLATNDGVYNFSINTALKDRKGTWWLANRNGGVDRIDAGVMSHHKLTATSGITRSVSCIFEDHTGRLWFGSRDASVFEWKDGDFEGLFLDTPALSKINAITEDAQGRIWFGGQRGIWRWDGSHLEDFSHDPSIAGAAFSTVTVGPDENLLAGTNDGRIFVFNGKSFRPLGKPSDLSTRWISTIIALPDEIWASTIGAGIFVWKDGKWHSFSTEAGIPDKRVTGLTLVGEDELWMGTLGGIVRASRAELLRHITNEESTASWLRIDRADGLITRECAGGSQPGVFRDSDGSLWFPTTAGPAGVKPERIAANSIPPFLQFQAVEINGVSHAMDSDTIVAGPGRVRIGFQFTGLSLSAPEKVSYRIQLVGLDEHPRLIGNQRRVDYQSVPAGSYSFQITAINGDGISNPTPTILRVVVRPHIWETPWFIALTVIGGLLLTLSVGWLVAKARMKQKIRELHLRNMLQAERSRISSDLHDDLGASLTELSILSEIASEDPDVESLRPSLNQLSVKAKRLLGAFDEIVWATNPTEDSLRSLIEYIPAFAREFLEVVQIPLRTKIERQIPDLVIGPRRRHNVLLAAREAINNAVKYAQPQSIFLEIVIGNGQLVVLVKDDGKGFDVEYAASGNGLINMKNRMTDCGGACRIESVRGQGTTITLTLPLPS